MNAIKNLYTFLVIVYAVFVYAVPINFFTENDLSRMSLFPSQSNVVSQIGPNGQRLMIVVRTDDSRFEVPIESTLIDLCKSTLSWPFSKHDNLLNNNTPLKRSNKVKQLAQFKFKVNVNQNSNQRISPAVLVLTGFVMCALCICVMTAMFNVGFKVVPRPNGDLLVDFWVTRDPSLSDVRSRCELLEKDLQKFAPNTVSV
eukprot:CFRG2305T1